jgi:P-type conjugative transfer protein TrbJ
MKQLYRKVFALASVISAPPVFAQAVVFDPTNFVQNVIQVARATEQIANQVHQLENEAQMIANQVQNLQHLDFNIVDRLRANLATTERLLDENRGIPYALSIVDQVFPSQYPLQYNSWTTRDQMQSDALLRWTNSLEALRTTVRMQAQARVNLNDDESSLADLVARSQWAYGNRDVTQATNQLLALHAKQAIEEQRLRIASDRAAALETARAIASEDKSRELRRRFMTAQTVYTPVPIDVGN